MIWKRFEIGQDDAHFIIHGRWWLAGEFQETSSSNQCRAKLEWWICILFLSSYNRFSSLIYLGSSWQAFSTWIRPESSGRYLQAKSWASKNSALEKRKVIKGSLFWLGQTRSKKFPTQVISKPKNIAILRKSRFLLCKANFNALSMKNLFDEVLQLACMGQTIRTAERKVLFCLDNFCGYPPKL